MTYCIGTNTFSIKTCLPRGKALSAIKRLWNDEIIEKLALFAKGGERSDLAANVFVLEELKFLETDELLDEVSDYSFAEDDYPEYNPLALNIGPDGVVQTFYCSEGGGFQASELTEYFCFMLHRFYGADEFYIRQSECEYPGGTDIIVSRVFSDGTSEVVDSED
jgi:hypothetical protein